MAGRLTYEDRREMVWEDVSRGRISTVRADEMLREITRHEEADRAFVRKLQHFVDAVLADQIMRTETGEYREVLTGLQVEAIRAIDLAKLRR